MYLMKFDKSSMKSMSVPWIESDFARNILEKKKTSKKLKDQAAFFIKNGYLILRNVISDKLIKSVVKDYKKIINSKTYKKNPDYFHYNKYPRVIEGWRKSKYIKSIAKNMIYAEKFKLKKYYIFYMIRIQFLFLQSIFTLAQSNLYTVIIFILVLFQNYI